MDLAMFYWEFKTKRMHNKWECELSSKRRTIREYRFVGCEREPVSAPSCTAVVMQRARRV